MLCKLLVKVITLCGIFHLSHDVPVAQTSGSTIMVSEPKALSCFVQTQSSRLITPNMHLFISKEGKEHAIVYSTFMNLTTKYNKCKKESNPPPSVFKKEEEDEDEEEDNEEDKEEPQKSPSSIRIISHHDNLVKKKEDEPHDLNKDWWKKHVHHSLHKDVEHFIKHDKKNLHKDSSLHPLKHKIKEWWNDEEEDDEEDLKRMKKVFSKVRTHKKRG